MELWGTIPASLCFLCHTPPLACKVVLSSGAVKSYRPAPTLPGLEYFHQVASQAADLIRQRVGQSLKTPLEGTPGREASLLTKEFAHILISEVGSSRTAKSSPSLWSLLTIMITKAFIKSFWE
jgi:hypothetical protein